MTFNKNNLSFYLLFNSCHVFYNLESYFDTDHLKMLNLYF